MEIHVRLNRLEVPAAGWMGLAVVHRAGTNHDLKRHPILVWARSVAASGKEPGNQQYPGEGMHLFLRLLSGGTNHTDAE